MICPRDIPLSLHLNYCSLIQVSLSCLYTMKFYPHCLTKYQIFLLLITNCLQFIQSIYKLYLPKLPLKQNMLRPSTHSKKRTDNPTEKWLEQVLHIENIQMASKQIKRCSTFLVIREMKIKTTVQYHPTPSRTTLKKKERKETT